MEANDGHILPLAGNAQSHATYDTEVKQFNSVRNNDFKKKSYSGCAKESGEVGQPQTVLQIILAVKLYITDSYSGSLKTYVP